ncbi:MAG TPA: UDP-N-acetylmuramoyl-tripeptide--D-alanyl-D-alanine ligase [Ignavibacteriaceae bacterium]|nr:UDP-N-acetylmuramoyl-tripeptide--D-alanyl-D-alanine ligase [Ignavibacteriaceae bacterium]
MKVKITLKDLFDLPGSEIVNPDEYKDVTDVTIDSRKIKKGSLFIAVKGEKFDGHDFIRDIIKNGAAAVVIDKKKYLQFNDIEIPVILVDDTIKALGFIAKIWRTKLKAKIVSLTGSAGKTTTKDMIATLLSEKYKVNKTLANNNNHIGVPLTILNTDNKHEVLVLEHGTNHFGEIPYTAEIAQPDYALITNIGNSHLEFLKNKKGVLKEKISLLETTKKRNGTLLINKDDELLSGIYKNYKKKISFGAEKKADVKGKILKYTDDGKPIVELKYKRKIIKTEFNLYGEQSFKNLLAASSVAFRLGLNEKQILNGIKKLAPPDKRLNVIKYPNFILIDDTYNANPESMKSSIELLSKIKSFKKKIAILGDMFELGDTAEKHHKNLARIIKKNKIDEVYTIGNLMEVLNQELKKSQIINQHFLNRDSLKNFIREKDLTNSVILVKGSRGMKMEEFVQQLKEKNL